MLRFQTAGESHGQALVAILSGLPAGLRIEFAYIDRELKRRQGGYGRGGRMKIESDHAQIVSGVRHGQTVGSPITMLIENQDWKNWTEAMAVENTGSETNHRPLLRPRPGHADLAGCLKYNLPDARYVLERASARETAARVAAGAIAKLFLKEFGIEVASHVIAVGSVSLDQNTPGTTPSGTESVNANSSSIGLERNSGRTPAQSDPGISGPDRATSDEAAVDVQGKGWHSVSFGAVLALRDKEEIVLNCLDPAVEARMKEEVDSATTNRDTVGGTFEVIAHGVPPGLGSCAQWDERLDGMLAQAIMSIQAVKAVEIGSGIKAAATPGSSTHDEIGYDRDSFRFTRKSNRAGGLEGGISNGEDIVVRGFLKPISTLRQPLESVDFESREPVKAAYERSDVCVVPAGGVAGEAMVALVLARVFLEKFGGDSLAETRRNFDGYIEQVRRF